MMLSCVCLNLQYINSTKDSSQVFCCKLYVGFLSPMLCYIIRGFVLHAVSTTQCNNVFYGSARALIGLRKQTLVK